MTILIASTLVILTRDLFAIYYSFEKATMVELQIIVNDVFMHIVFAEIIKSVIIGRRKPEMYLAGVAEVGFVISVREIIVSVVNGQIYNLLISTIASLIMTVVLLLIYKWIMPHREIVSKKK
jgi:uncharacterized membrane protein (DUF373 family)